ncbi:ABC transporter ATP-binding protein [Cecembia calidifontis]|jgi:lipoprotein-releasing system ATP-binding protein|uniref:Lipoprotein-releasing system ATP-binding protein n=1 Tax=Cecembia calidifontis TaxID=1187080 RepID=A0A4Q7PEI7_9BACT|nr:ABC transporter ATP-binding protein [Cecembia calidifontis]RZS98208.1 lipoprotein-releasing system ATP-binding protein [Cecembia calidifontis]
MEVRKAIEGRKINKFFYSPSKTQVLIDITLTVNKGEFVSIMGKSGCGKSTLLYILSTMDTDYEGELYLDDKLITGESSDYLSHLRNEKIGFVFQFHYLINEFTVLENVMIPGLKLNQKSREELEHIAMEKLKIFSMETHALKKANQLSGGQKQRVSIARALINNPLIVMSDEPTGNLDKKNSDLVLGIFKELVQDFHQTILMVTHDHDMASKTDRTILMEDGMIISHG